MTEEAFDRDTGEILSTRAADGSRLPPPSATFADTIRLLNDGQFDLDASAELRELVTKIADHADNAKGVAKGSIAIKLDIKMMNGAHVVTPSLKIVAPTPDQPGTLLFSDDEGRLSRNRPDQGVFFGTRVVADNSARDTRTV
ncbi:hypothetical protein GGQ80_002060 [Sphingomonas jinjuensis]|uniref:Uncharacterized protein n=1 Tax=Sphingomonas jinjuensis TaxID=535907 RepID=A0A840F857_9SPHN|nr:hypothetical protein [Sphingomonas jinjuensis]MBB4154150.1 hypothetical protein [Sphingomonas jinjuensis]